MSKKPKRSRHRIPACALQPKSDPVDERYQAEIDASITKLEARYRKAEKALAAAERRAEAARAELAAAAATASRAARQRRYDQLLLIVEARRRELHQIELLMQQDGYSRDSRRRHIRQEAGAITIPLGATTGQRPKPAPVPMFPVQTKSGTA
jgi:hypothetical protein